MLKFMDLVKIKGNEDIFTVIKKADDFGDVQIKNKSGQTIHRHFSNLVKVNENQ